VIERAIFVGFMTPSLAAFAGTTYAPAAGGTAMGRIEATTPWAFAAWCLLVGYRTRGIWTAGEGPTPDDRPPARRARPGHAACPAATLRVPVAKPA
jgi:hypothetical protein